MDKHQSALSCNLWLPAISSGLHDTKLTQAFHLLTAVYMYMTERRKRAANHRFDWIVVIWLTKQIIIRPRRSRSAAANSHQTFLWTICQSVGMSIGLSSALWKNSGSDRDAVWHHRSDGYRDEAGSGVCGSVDGKGYFWGWIWVGHCNQ